MLKIQQVKIGPNESRGKIEETKLGVTYLSSQTALEFFGFFF